MNLAPFLTLSAECPDFNESDTQAEISRLFQRQKAIAALVAGTLDAETVLDLLSEHSIDATEYVDEVEENLEFLIETVGI